MYAPVSFPPCPTLLFIPGANGYPELISRGSVLSIDPTRLIIKRLILTGTPTKVNKGSRHSLNTAVVRYMFFTPEDIHYFKPVELRTKEGRAGHILGSVGTHGAMKCSFDRQIQQSDTICMCLYKRVFPKWPEGGFRGLVHHEVGEDDCESVGGNVSDIDEQ